MPMQALGAPPADLGPSRDYPTGYAGYGAAPQTSQGAPTPSPERPKALDYALKGLGLLCVAVVSGFLWFLIRNNPAPQHAPITTPTSSGVYQFTAFHDPVYDTDCAANATEQVAAYLRAHPCTQLTRKLYTTSLANGETVVTSIAVVRMSTPTLAVGLNRLSALDGSGHVRDLVEQGVVVPGGPRSLEDGGYYAKVSGSSVIIAVTEFNTASLDTTDNLTAEKKALTAVSQDAMRLGTSG
ncbi:MAG TPA: hypothetical protein VHW44_10145 [Pseudonocardiaceae bacterium]|jgi:hypothetical protein|nr:hypothetical protein [Pseudonocardiaceae bacterium]